MPAVLPPAPVGTASDAAALSTEAEGGTNGATVRVAQRGGLAPLGSLGCWQKAVVKRCSELAMPSSGVGGSWSGPACAPGTARWVSSGAACRIVGCCGAEPERRGLGVKRWRVATTWGGMLWLRMSGRADWRAGE